MKPRITWAAIGAALMAVIQSLIGYFGGLNG